MTRSDVTQVALGKAPADVVIEGGQLVNVATAEIYPADIAIKGDRIACVGDISYTRGSTTEIINASGKYLTPGLVETHLHSYHLWLRADAYVPLLLKNGVTATADGFYGEGIVGGKEAVRFQKETYEDMPIRLIFLVPTLAYMQNRLVGLKPTDGLTIEDMLEMLSWDGCYGLEEPELTVPYETDEGLLRLFEATLAARKTITGHGAGIDGQRRQAMAAVGASTDHEAIAVDDALAKARLGIRLLVRQGGTGANDIPQVARTYTEHGIDTRMLTFCCDIATPSKLLTEGAINENIRVAISHGVPPVKAIQMATINAAEVFFAQSDIGILAPGRYADILLVEDLVEFSISRVLFGGETVVLDGEFVGQLPKTEYPKSFYNTVKLERPVHADDFRIRADDADEVEVRVIGVRDGQFWTEHRVGRLRVIDGTVQENVDEDILLCAMVDRFQRGTGVGVGFVQGFHLKSGAIASSNIPFCESLIIVGTNPHDMAVAANKLAECGGGHIAVDGGEVTALAEFPLLGLFSDDPLEIAIRKLDEVDAAAKDMGSLLTSPLQKIEFIGTALRFPQLKISAEGLFLTEPPGPVDVVLAAREASSQG